MEDAALAFNAVLCATGDFPQHDLSLEGSENDHPKFHCRGVNNCPKSSEIGFQHTVDIDQTSSMANQTI